jgi:hypothetical protein
MRASYRLADAIVEVATDDRETGRWLAEFLSPCFAIEPPGQGGFVVQFTACADAHAVLSDRRSQMPLQTMPIFGLDRAVVSLPGWTESTGAWVLADDEWDCFYRVQQNIVQVVARPANRRSRVGLMRIIRELAAAHVLANPDRIDLHAAAFVARERAVLLVGAKRAGKTTLLVHALSSGQASLMANDRVFVDSQHGQALGVPSIVVVRDRTVQIFPALARGLPPGTAHLHTGEIAAGVTSTSVGQRCVMSPAQLAGQVGAALIPQAPLGAIVFPEISESTRGWSLQRMTSAEAAAGLRANLYGARSGPRAATLIQDIVGKSREASNQPLDSIVGKVPILSCRLGPDAYHENASAWLRTLPLNVG